jgi:hypothetical protein
MIFGQPIVKGRWEKIDLIQIIGPEPLQHGRKDEWIGAHVAGIFTRGGGFYSDRLSGLPGLSRTLSRTRPGLRRYANRRFQDAHANTPVTCLILPSGSSCMRQDFRQTALPGSPSATPGSVPGSTSRHLAC